MKRAKPILSVLYLLSAATVVAAGCGETAVEVPGSSSGAGAGGSSSEATTSSAGTTTSSGDATVTTSASSGGGQGGDATTTTSTGTGGAGAGAETPDPNLDGPYTFTEIDGTADVDATGDAVPIHCAYPTAGPEAGPYPVIVVAHGFQLPAKQYYGYVKRLASFGYVALTADFPTSFFSVNNVESAKDLSGALDWAAAEPDLAGKADVENAGMTGHSLGGKVALLAASMDDRVKAAITLDPVDSAVNCSPADCPDVSELMPLPIPTGFLGETTDATGSFQACAPAADNFTTFFAGTTSPSLSVTVLGANHMSFLDDVASCGLTCSFCNAATASNASVNALSRAYVAAFYERYLRGNTAYDAYLTGSVAEERYVATGAATIESK